MESTPTVSVTTLLSVGASPAVTWNTKAEVSVWFETFLVQKQKLPQVFSGCVCRDTHGDIVRSTVDHQVISMHQWTSQHIQKKLHLTWRLRQELWSSNIPVYLVNRSMLRPCSAAFGLAALGLHSAERCSALRLLALSDINLQVCAPLWLSQTSSGGPHPSQGAACTAPLAPSSSTVSSLDRHDELAVEGENIYSITKQKHVLWLYSSCDGLLINYCVFSSNASYVACSDPSLLR